MAITFDSQSIQSAFEKNACSIAEHVNNLSSKIGDIERERAIAYLKLYDQNAIFFFEKLVKYYDKCKNELLEYQSQLDLVKGGYWQKRKVRKEIKAAIHDYTERQNMLMADMEKIKAS